MTRSSSVAAQRTILAVAALLGAGTVTAQTVDASGQFLDERLRQAEELFFSARQPDSIAAFGALIAELEARAEPESPDWVRLLTAALGYRAQANFNLGDEATAGEDLRRLLAAVPGSQFDSALASPKFIEFFAALRAGLVGEVAASIVPPEATLFIDGREIADHLELIALPAGSYQIDVELLGYAAFRRQLAVPAGGVTGLEVTLDRQSSVLTVPTRSPGVEILLDGTSMGETAVGAAAGTAGTAMLRFAGVMPGRHTVELQRDGYRSQRVDLDVASLGDYRLDLVTLEPARGEVVLDGLPAEASLLVNDAAAIAIDGRLQLVPGSHVIAVDAGWRGAFEGRVELADRASVSLAIRLQPTVRFLGVVGGDKVSARAVTRAVDAALAGGPWARRDERAFDEEALTAAGLPVDRLRVLAATGSDAAADSVGFAAAQAGLQAAHPASVYMLAVLSDDLVATHADIWIFAAAPGPAFGDRLRLNLAAADVDARMTDSLLGAAPFERAWFGADLVDSLNTSGAVVLAVTPESPAAAAGIRMGDEIVGADGIEIVGTASLEALLAKSAPGADVTLLLASREVVVTLGSSPGVIDPVNASLPAVSTWIELSRLRADAESPVDPWVLALNETALMLRAGEWARAVRLLRATEFPTRQGVGASTARYWLALALSELGPDYADMARESFAAAAADRTARLTSDDGPLVWPLARARASQ